MQLQQHHNLVLDPHPFVGRADERAVLHGELRDGARVLAIVGPAGIGKSRLAQQVARDAATLCGEALICSGAGGLGIEETVAAALGRSPGQGLPLARALAGRGPTLLVLDGFDGFDGTNEGTVETVSFWLEHAPELRVLVTALGPPALPGARSLALGALPFDDARALYLQTARRTWPDRIFPHVEQPAVDELLVRLDCMPLAIELAAARIRVLPARVLLPRLSERFHLLQASGSLPSLEEAWRRTWAALQPAEARALARLSVFSGSFCLEAAEAVLGARDSIALIDALRARGLLRSEEETEARFELGETARHFAALRLEEAGLVAETTERMVAFYVERAEAQAVASDGADAAEAIAWLSSERPNLLLAHRACRRSDPRSAARLGVALALPLVGVEGDEHIEREVLDESVAAARETGDRSLLVWVLRARSRSAKAHGFLDRARRDIDEAIDSARRAGAAFLEAVALSESTQLRVHVGDTSGADEELERALAIGRQLENPLIEGFARGLQGVVAECRGEVDAAGPHFEEALEIFRRHGHLRLQANMLVRLGSLRAAERRLRDARRLLDESQAIFRRLGLRTCQSNGLVQLADGLLAAGLVDDAEACAREGLSLQREMGSRRVEALCLGTLGLVALERGEARHAEQRLDDALAILRAVGDRRHRALLLAFVATTEAMLDRLQDARRSMAEAQRELDAIGDATGLAMASLLEGLVELAEARVHAQALQPVQAAACEQRARARLEEARPGSVYGTVAHRLLEAAVARRDVPAVLAPVAQAPAAALRVGPEGAWFEAPGAPRADLRRRGAMRLLFLALVEQRLLAPGVGLSQQALADLGWPGEQIMPDAAAARVYTSIRTLRAMGLADVLRKHADGYLLDPALPVVRETR